MSDRFDVVVIGSGPAGVHASVPLAAAGARVAMLDVGHEPPAYLSAAPDVDFETLRRERDDQCRWFLGDDYSGIPLEGSKGGALISGNRSYVVRDAAQVLPLEGNGAQVLQSLARGGLAAAWGAECSLLSKAELDAIGIPAAGFDAHYEAVVRRIGVSGPGTFPGVQPPPDPDHHAEALLAAASRRAAHLGQLGVSLERPLAAVLTQDLGARRASRYADLDYFVDPGRAVYRPSFTLEELRERPSFQYCHGLVVQRIEDQPDGVRIDAAPIDQPGAIRTFHARRGIVAAGAVGTARLLLRSFRRYDVDTPLLAKGHDLIPSWHLRTTGQAGRRQRVSLCQLLMIEEAGEAGIRGASAQLYSYKSLQLFRLIGDVPLPYPESLRLMALWSPALIIADVRYRVRPAAWSTMRLTPTGAGDQVRVAIAPDAAELASRRRARQLICRGLRSIGVWPLRTMMCAEGSASHYAGTVPVRETPSGPLSADANGRLHGAQHVYVADSALFRELPSLPPTLTIMANAHRIGEHVRQSLTA